MTTKESPLVTIAMPVFNAGNHLKLAVDSILQQTFTDWELLVIDDGSSDGAVNTLRDLTDARVHILCDGKNRGLAYRLNEAMDMARGTFLARMDQDDVSYPERLSKQLFFLNANPEIDLVSVRCIAICSENKLVGELPFRMQHDQICATPAQGFYMPHPSWMGRIEWFHRHRYATPGPYFCEDQELLLRSYTTSKFFSIPEVLFAYRVRSQINWTKSLRTRRTILGIQLNIFSHRKQWNYLILSLATCSIRVCLDTLNAVVQQLGYLGLQRYRSLPLDADEIRRWNSVKTKLLP